MTSENQRDRGKKPRSYYVDYTKGKNSFRDRRQGTNNSNNSRYNEAPEISCGHRGFLITSVDEVKSYLEMRNILEGYFEQLYNVKEDVETSDKKNTNVEDELESELKQLRRNRPFKQVKTHCRNSLFINIMKDFSYIDPNAVVDKFFNDLAEKREMKSSNTFKVLPVLDTFRNSVACAKEAVSNLLNNTFKTDVGARKYFIEFQSRGNYKLNPDDRQKMIEGIADTFTELRPEWTVDRESADYIVVLVSLKNVCCVSFLKDYFKRCKYNVIEFYKLLVPNTQQVKSGDTTDDNLNNTGEILNQGL